jgi:putative NADH-flavin reductase
MLPTHRTLLFGATGATGRYILTAAISAGDSVTVFVRSPDKIPNEQRDKITVVVGDYLDLDAVRNVILFAKPTGIIFAASPLRGSPIQDLNSFAVPCVVEALKSEGRLADVRLVYLGGLFTPPKGQTLPLMMRIVKSILVPTAGTQAQIADNDEVAKYLYTLEDSETSLKYTFVRMCVPQEGSSRGLLMVAVDSAWSVAFCDMGTFLVEISHNLGTSENKAVVVNY